MYNQYPSVAHSCQQIPPSHISISPFLSLVSSQGLEAAACPVPCLCPLQAISVQSPPSHTPHHCSKHNSGCTMPTGFLRSSQATGTDSYRDWVLMATNLLYRAIKKIDVVFYPPIDLHPKGHPRRSVPLGYNSTMASFCHFHVNWTCCSSTGEGQSLILSLCSLSSVANGCMDSVLSESRP